MRAVQELRYLILGLQREGNRLLAADLRPLGLTPAQAEALDLLAAHQPLTLNGLGELLVCESGTNPSRIIDRLAGAGLLRRQTDPADRRQVLLTLTADGQKLAQQVATIELRLDERLEELIAGQPTTATLALLRALAANFPAGRAIDRRRALASGPSPDAPGGLAATIHHGSTRAAITAPNNHHQRKHNP